MLCFYLFVHRIPIDCHQVACRFVVESVALFRSQAEGRMGAAAGLSRRRQPPPRNGTAGGAMKLPLPQFLERCQANDPIAWKELCTIVDSAARSRIKKLLR